MQARSSHSTRQVPSTRADQQPDFDRLARPYRWFEYLTLGPLLERCRFALLPLIGDARHALILGDGDGRSAARMLTLHPHLSADLIDLSPAMLKVAHARVMATGTADHVRFYCSDLRAALPVQLRSPADLVTAHFLLDCLSPEEAASLIQRLIPLLAPGAALLVSEFAVPTRQPLRFLAASLITILYRAFAVLTGLGVRRLPDYAAVLRSSGFTLVDERTWLGGILRSELWRWRTQYPSDPDPQATPPSLQHSQQL